LTKPIPKVYATRFFQLITSRQFAEAERILERIKQKMHVSERNRGYFQALCGMLLTQKNNDDRYAFLSGMDLTNRKQLKNFRQEFLSYAESRLHAEYDRGFFEAWADYTRILPRLTVPIPPANNKTAQMKEAEPRDKTKAEEENVEHEPPLETERVVEPTPSVATMEQAELRQRTLSEFAE